MTLKIPFRRSAAPTPIFLEVPQGFAKKIEIELLLPDLLLQFPDPAPGLAQCLS
ncbi:hypothetical protein [Mesorhizobium sp. M0013]|uniref:hypothetical protein n=1 Tax=Mesorhizobium sp. M0013 TaxID=2956841 RepID=UPI003334DEAA